MSRGVGVATYKQQLLQIPVETIEASNVWLAQYARFSKVPLGEKERVSLLLARRAWACSSAAAGYMPSLGRPCTSFDDSVAEQARQSTLWHQWVARVWHMESPRAPAAKIAANSTAAELRAEVRALAPAASLLCQTHEPRMPRRTASHSHSSFSPRRTSAARRFSATAAACATSTSWAAASSCARATARSPAPCSWACT